MANSIRLALLLALAIWTSPAAAQHAANGVGGIQTPGATFVPGLMPPNHPQRGTTTGRGEFPPSPAEVFGQRRPLPQEEQPLCVRADGAITICGSGMVIRLPEQQWQR